MSKEYYSYYELLFSLRKEYLKNQELINTLLSYIRITSNPLDDYNSHLVFKPNSKDNIESLILLIKKRQSCIRIFLSSLYDSIVYGDPNLKAGVFTFVFRMSQDYVYLLDGNQDGRYLNAKLEIENKKEFIELYKQLMAQAICKDGRKNLFFGKEFMQLSNNGIHLFHVQDDYKKGITLDYNGLEDLLITNNPSYLRKLMELKINKNIIPESFRSIIDSNMEEFLYSIERGTNKNQEFFSIADRGKKLVLQPSKRPPQIIL